MTGLIIHPLRIAALDRMKVLRVPFREQPKKEAALIDRELLDTKGIWQTWLRNPDGGIDQDFNAQYFKPPYAPGDYFVAEPWMLYHTINSVVRSDGRSYEEVSDGLAAYKEDGYGTVNDFIKHIQLVSGADFRGIEVKKTRWLPATTMPPWAARHILTLGPPVPCRLGDVTEEMIGDEGYDGSLYPCKRCHPTHYEFDPKEWHKETWNLMYPKHPYSPERWTWGYPVEVKSK